MTPGRGTLTDQLLSVIEVIQLGKKSGLLTIERGERGTIEQGELTFVHGQIIQARCGPYSGQQALNWLRSWNICRFLFVPTEIERTARSTGKLPSNGSQSASVNSTTQEQGTFSGFPPPGMISSTGSVPRRICPDHEALRLLDHHGLSRLHRRLFLLIDGHRTSAEIIRLMGRRPEEVYHLLRDLERIHIIQQ
ncbi:MAG: DUF4388 domain-containing protein [Ktedonobacteraceae bacterium]|nr:DUF4388 domain-containing protein [Ktedonobacteraceae bacterium]